MTRECKAQEKVLSVWSDTSWLRAVHTNTSIPLIFSWSLPLNLVTSSKLSVAIQRRWLNYRMITFDARKTIPSLLLLLCLIYFIFLSKNFIYFKYFKILLFILITFVKILFIIISQASNKWPAINAILYAWLAKQHFQS